MSSQSPGAGLVIFGHLLGNRGIVCYFPLTQTHILKQYVRQDLMCNLGVKEIKE